MTPTIEILRADQTAMMQVRAALVRKSFIDYCRIIFPDFYREERRFLTDMCNQIQAFIEDDNKHFLVVNAPPRHGKSLTAQNLTAWLFGRNPASRVMTASYNERLASIFSRNVRNTIQTQKVGKRIVFSDIFPRTKVKFGEAAAQMWTIDGQAQTSYLATSPHGTATGFGCDYLVCDDLIRNADEAYNERLLDDIWSWFVNTMLSRLEGRRKCIIIMTRWSTRDIAGRIMEAYPDQTEVITYQAKNSKTGKMLCPEILDSDSYELIKREMNVDIVEANYNQKPIDIAGRLYSEFKTYDKSPVGNVVNFTDTADTGTDFLCSISGISHENEFYITDLVFTDESMEITEPAVASLLHDGHTYESFIESNNGGRGFARNVENILRNKYNSNLTVIHSKPQTKNKESRILSSSAWVQNHIYMPMNWKNRYPEFYKQVMSYQRKGRNAHDDAVDVLASIYEYMTDEVKPEVIDKSSLLNGQRRPLRGSSYWS